MQERGSFVENDQVHPHAQLMLLERLEVDVITEDHRSDSTSNRRWYLLQFNQTPVPEKMLSNIPIYVTTGSVFDMPSNVTTTHGNRRADRV